jgi:hypothetical protein
MSTIRIDVLDCMADKKVSEMSGDMAYLRFLARKPASVASIATEMIEAYYEANSENGAPFKGDVFFESASLLTGMIIKKINQSIYDYHLSYVREYADELGIDWRTGEPIKCQRV